MASEAQRSPEQISVLTVETRKSPEPAVVAAGSAEQGIAEGRSSTSPHVQNYIQPNGFLLGWLLFSNFEFSSGHPPEQLQIIKKKSM